MAWRFAELTDDEDALALVARSVERLRLVCRSVSDLAVKRVCARVLCGLPVLGVSGLGCHTHAVPSELMQLRRLMQTHVPGSVLAGSLERVALGMLATAALVDRLWADGIGVEGW